MAGFIGGLMQVSYDQLFKDLSEGQIDRVLQSFAFKKCVPHTGVDSVMRKRFIDA